MSECVNSFVILSPRYNGLALLEGNKVCSKPEETGTVQRVVRPLNMCPFLLTDNGISTSENIIHYNKEKLNKRSVLIIRLFDVNLSQQVL